MARWFGPKVTGYGIGPRSWQGWLASAAALALIVSMRFVDVTAFGLPMWTRLAAMVAILAAYLLLVRATYGPD